MKHNSFFYLPAVMMAGALLLFAACKKDNAGATVDLSASGSANCYVVSAPGRYSLKTVRGITSASLTNVSSVEVLWESFGTAVTPGVGDIISNVSYADNKITFSTPSSLKNGNAVIAAKDGSGEILWSWHIWVCDGFNPASTAQTYNNSAGVMMDRNLGATSATPGDVGALGLLYQWGRKDPFLGSDGISSATQAASTISWPDQVSSNSTTGLPLYTVQHPTTFVAYNTKNYDWYYTGDDKTDNDRWQTTKTIYDPCPPGWRVPSGGSSSGVWSKANGSSNWFGHTWDATNMGMNFSGKFGDAATIWYPAAGWLFYGGGLSQVGSLGRWWSCTPTGNKVYFFSLDENGVYPANNDGSRASGFSVRCVRE